MKKVSGKPKKKPIKVSSRKSKGRILQQWTCEKISQLLNVPWGKDEEIASREMGQSGTDVRLSPRIRKMFTWSTETKNQERWSMDSFIKQAKDNCYENTDWLLILKKNRMNPIAVLDAEVFFSLLKEIFLNKTWRSDNTK